MVNVNITASVGRGGTNSPGDVRKIQELLNEHLQVPLRPLTVNGTCDGLTIAAIEEFQRRVMKLSRPDGRVDPQGATMAALSPVALRRSSEVLVPYLPGRGLYVKTSGSNSLFGTPKSLASIERLARKVAQELDASVGVVDISYEGGGKHPDHSSHRRGVDVDIRPLRTDKESLPVDISNAEYSHDLTKAMVGYLQEDPNVQLILFNDTKISGVTWSNGHGNHLHVRFKE
jgi:hypothetical protein